MDASAERRASRGRRAGRRPAALQADVLPMYTRFLVPWVSENPAPPWGVWPVISA
jgi:hypothetical protein